MCFARDMPAGERESISYRIFLKGKYIEFAVGKYIALRKAQNIAKSTSFDVGTGVPDGPSLIKGLVPFPRPSICNL